MRPALCPAPLPVAAPLAPLRPLFPRLLPTAQISPDSKLCIPPSIPAAIVQPEIRSAPFLLSRIRASRSCHVDAQKTRLRPAIPGLTEPVSFPNAIALQQAFPV